MSFLDKFLEFKNEADATRKGALLAVIIITLGLASLSVTGIVATADWNLLSALPILGMIVAVLGAELLATVAFIRMLTASTLWRKIAGAFIFVGLAAVGVHNAENGAKVVWPDRFAVSSGRLAAEAELAGEEAATLKTAQDAAIGGTGTELERVRTEIAKLEGERDLMTAQSPEGIAQAQTLLVARGEYYGRIDSVRDVLTEKAMRSYAEKLSRQITTLKAREDALMAGQASPVAQANTDKRLLQIENADKATAAFWAWLWLIIMLCVLESARSLSLWALITDISAGDANRDRQRSDELAEMRHQNELAALAAQRVAAQAAPVATPPEPAPAAIPEPVETVSAPVAPIETELPPVDQRARKGGKNASFLKEAKKAAKNRVLILADRSDAQVMKVAAE